MNIFCVRCCGFKSIDFFFKNKSNKNGISRTCLECVSQAQKIKNINKRYRDWDEDQLKKNNKKIVSLEKQKIWKEKYKLKAKRKYVYTDEKKKYRKEYYEKNKKTICDKIAKYRKNKIKIDPFFKFKNLLRTRLVVFLKRKGFYKLKKISKMEEIVGVSSKTLKMHIERQFTKGMTWENHGLYGWHIDHIIPLSYAKTERELIELCHYTNLQPLWAKDNLLKKAKIPIVQKTLIL